MRPTLIAAVIVASLITMSVSAHADTARNVMEAVQRAILTNPEVEARWHAFLAAKEEVDVARGGFRPSIDLSAGIGRERLDPPTGPTLHYTRSGATLSLTQMLYDGQSTRNEVERMSFASLVRYYEVLDAAGSTALEAVRAYEDVLRYRELTKLARENYVQHKLLFDQIKQRTDSGVSRRVDFELAGGRLALAESNLLTEAANLHDVSARYQRIVGELPTESLPPVQLVGVETSPKLAEALRLAYSGNPALNAATENIRAAQAELNRRDAPFRPRLDFRAREDLGRNIDGVAGNRANQVVELLLNINLYKGNSDSAARRQYAENLNQAKNLRDKTCRDIRQTLAISHNDNSRLKEQIDYLERHRNAVAKARVAYRQQFDIGQRTLLDLLDIENEYFQASRAHFSAAHDMNIAQARSLTSMGQLMTALGVSRDEMPIVADSAPDRAGVDPDSACPAEGPDMLRFDKQAILDEALASGNAQPFLPFVAPVPAVATPESAAAPAPAAASSDNWYAQQNPKSFVLQFLRSQSKADIDAFQAKHDLKDCHSYSKLHNKQTAHVLTCGLYANLERVQKAAAQQPSKLRSFDLLPIRVEDILKSMQR